MSRLRLGGNRFYLRVRMINFLLGVATVALSGCISHLTRQGVAANEAADDIYNQVLVLNVLRAYQQRPMTLTGLTSIHGISDPVTPSLNLTFPFGPGPAAKNTAASGIAVASPSFDVAPLESQEFTNGFTNEINEKTLGYYLDLGWPKSLVLHLFIRQIDLIAPVSSVRDICGGGSNVDLSKKHKRSKKDAKPKPGAEEDTCVAARYVNQADDLDAFAKFHDLIEDLANCDVSVVKSKPTDDAAARTDLSAALLSSQLPRKKEGPTSAPDNQVGPDLDLEHANDLDALVDAANAKLQVKAVTSSKGSTVYRLLQEADREFLFTLPTVASTGSDSATAKQKKACGSGIGKLTLGDSKKKVTAKAYLRSPESALYYLGEVTRRELDGGFSDTCGDMHYLSAADWNSRSCGWRGNPVATRPGNDGSLAASVPSTQCDLQGKSPVICVTVGIHADGTPKVAPLFDLRKGNPADPMGDNVGIQTKFGPDTYWIPKPLPPTYKNEALSVLALMKLVINNQRAAKELPSTVTTNVRVIP